MATITGDNGNNVLNGTEEEDIINGLGGNDTIDSVDRPENIFAGSIAPQRDVVDASTGDDFVTGGKLDQLDGGDGNDFLLVNFNFNGPVAGSATPITLTLDANGTGTASDGTSITGFESVNFNLSDTGDNVVNTGNVITQITGGNGNDTLTTGTGDDFVFGGGGNNIISTGAGNDTISAGSGADVIFGGDGDDTFGVNIYTDGSDRVNLSAGNDTVRFDRFDGGSGNVRLTFTSAEVGNGNANDAGNATNQDAGLAVRVQAEDASGNLTGPISRYDDEGTTFIAGTQGITFDVRDLVSGTERGNTFEGVVLGTSGDDALTFFPPFRAAQNFYYNSGQGNDIVVAGEGNDFLVGGLGNDVLSSGAGTDTILGGGGDDLLIGGAGADVLDGGAGFDQVLYRASTEGVIADLGSPATSNNGDAAGDTYVGIEGLGGSQFADLLIGGSSSTLSGFDGDDNLVGGSRSDYLFGDNGNDNLYGGDGGDYLSGGAGFDAARYDNATAGVTAVLIDSSFNRDDAGGDVYVGIEAVVGSQFNDILIGDNGSNLLAGQDGNDFLDGFTGNDTLYGGAGADIFSFKAGSGNDVVADFAPQGSAHDTILIGSDVNGSGIVDFASLQSHLTQTGADVLIDLGSSNSVLLQNVELSQLTAADFAFA